MKRAVALAVLLLAAPVVCHAGASGVFSAVALTSDYRYQGASNTDGNAAAQLVVHYFRPDGFYAGAFASQVDFKDAGTSYELDLYGGKNFAFDGGKTELKLQAMSSTFPDNRTSGPTYDFWTFETVGKHGFGKLTASALLAFVPEGSYRSGKVWRVETEADYAASPHLTLKALLGEQWGGRGHERAYWSLGPSLAWKALTFDVRYVDTDRTRANCGYLPKICDATVTGTVTYALPLVLF
jgi:uncharacterized protein (TIGR02001 family)